VSKEELNLFEFASASMTETRATTSKIVGCKIVDSRLIGTSFHRIPDDIGRCTSTVSRSISQNLSEQFSLTYSRMLKPTIDKRFAPGWHWDSPDPSAFAHEIYDYPVIFPQLQLFQSQTSDFRSPQSTSQK
jgi:hypothetical protein